MRRKELFYYVTWGSNVTRDVHWCLTVFYQQIENSNIANQIHGFTIDYGKFILMPVSRGGGGVPSTNYGFTFDIWIAYFYWVILRGEEPMRRLGDWQGSKCKCKCFAAFSLSTKSFTPICIYGDCNAILLLTSRKNLDFCSAIGIRLLVYQYKWFVSVSN